MRSTAQPDGASQAKDISVKATALDADPSALDEQERGFVENIRKHGWFRTYIFAEANSPSFSFTTGFWVSQGFPEVIIFSIDAKTAHSILWDLYKRLAAGSPPPVGSESPAVFGNASGVLVPVAKRHYYEHLGWSRWFYAGDEFPCLQLVWPDPNGRFPWQAEFDERYRASQPDLTENGWIAALAH